MSYYVAFPAHHEEAKRRRLSGKTMWLSVRY